MSDAIVASVRICPRQLTAPFLSFGIALFLCAAAPAAVPSTGPAAGGKVRLTISAETTRLTGPLNADGTVNYVAALNEAWGSGVTPENNAAVLLLRATGPSRLTEKVRGRIYERLGMQPLASQGQYFVDFFDWARRREVPVEKVDEMFEPAQQRPWKEAEHPEVAAWLKENEQPLALVTESTHRAHYHFPVASSGSPETLIGALNLYPLITTRAMSNALWARAMLRIGTDNFEGAWQDLLTIHRLARLVSQRPTLVDRSVGGGLETLALHADRLVAASGRPSARQLRRMLTDLHGLPPLPPLADAIDGYERLNVLDLLAFYARPGGGPGVRIPTGVSVLSDIGLPLRSAEPSRPEIELPAAAPPNTDWDSAFRRVNAWYDRYAAAVKRPALGERQAALEAFDREAGELLDRVARQAPDERRIEDVLLVSFARGLGRNLLKDERTLMDRSLTEVAVALAAYRAEHGDYPRALDALRSDYLPQVPEDRFAGRPLQYRPNSAGYLLYSVGPNCKDDGGGSTPGSDDIVAQVPAPG